MLKKLAAKLNRVVARHGEHPETLEEKITSKNTNLLINLPGQSSSPNGNGYNVMLTTKDASPYLFLNSPSTGSPSTSQVKIPQGVNPDNVDQEVELDYTIKVKSYGKPAKLRHDLAVRIARQIHHGGIKNFIVRDPLGNWWKYDTYGDDQGHHGPDHEEPLLPA